MGPRARRGPLEERKKKAGASRRDTQVIHPWGGSWSSFWLTTSRVTSDSQHWQLIDLPLHLPALPININDRNFRMINYYGGLCTSINLYFAIKGISPRNICPGGVRGGRYPSVGQMSSTSPVRALISDFLTPSEHELGTSLSQTV
ncbi:hypothetical protein J6590_037821 [Homalodisca vitripennis]|nr:hypothetical protein J6590_037821 [Homalodisca vitripennis]